VVEDVTLRIYIPLMIGRERPTKRRKRKDMKSKMAEAMERLRY
jgi:hypothetical protein